MKIIIYFLLAFSYFSVIGQNLSYTAKIELGPNFNTPQQEYYKFSLDGNYSSIVSNGHVVEAQKISTLVDVKNTNLTLKVSSSCASTNFPTCLQEEVFTITAVELLSGIDTFGSPGAFVYSFRPNGITITPVSNTNVNACTQIALEAKGPPHTGPDFPDEAYHWLFKLESESYWRNVPLTVKASNNVTKKINNTPKPVFNMQELLGDNYMNHFGKVTFAIGVPMGDTPVYSTNTITVDYSPMAPLIHHIEYIPPACSGGEKELKVYFNRDLSAGEVLQDFSITNSTNSSMILYQAANNITSFIEGYYISIKGFNVEDGKYDIIYQAFLNGSPKGCIKSVDDIKITNTEPLKFKIIQADNPTCNNGSVTVSIEASGGTPPYFYDDLNGDIEMLNGLTQIKKIRFDSSDIYKTTVELKDLELRQYNIKVTDSNNCIEQ